jgi:SAM-dependent methyltransferase
MRCPECGLYTLVAAAVPGAAELDRTQFEGAFRDLRLANYTHILERLRLLTPLPGRTLLDVGCSSGWFLEVATGAGCVCYGIEPDGFFYDRLASQPPPGCHLVQGFFDRDLPASWGPFDVITFHDVFEHLPRPVEVLRAARRRLAQEGHVVLSLPSADGFAFQVGRGLYRLGITAPLERMFQLQYPYPHLFYFSRRSLVRVARRAGFAPVLVEPLRSFSARGALHRARMDRARNICSAIKQYASAGALLAFAAVERFLPADNVLVILRADAA